MFRISQFPSLEDVDWESAFADPRLITNADGQRITLDAPSRRDGLCSIDDISTYEGYRARPYVSYREIRGGDIMYYGDSSINVPFVTPTLFDTSKKVYKFNYVDPMSTCKPEYRLSSPTRPCCANELSFIYDSGQHRQDLMQRQMYRRFWTHPSVF